MGTIKNFEDLHAWQKARELAGYLYGLTRRDKLSRDFGLRNQIQDAAGSVMHNIAAGFESGTDPEFVRFLKMARRSAGEVQSELYLAIDCAYITADELRLANGLASDTKRLINGLVSYLRKTAVEQDQQSGAASAMRPAIQPANGLEDEQTSRPGD